MGSNQLWLVAGDESMCILHEGNRSVRPRVVSALGHFDLKPFGPESFRPLLVGHFGLIFSNPRLVT